LPGEARSFYTPPFLWTIKGSLGGKPISIYGATYADRISDTVDIKSFLWSWVITLLGLFLSRHFYIIGIILLLPIFLFIRRKRWNKIIAIVSAITYIAVYFLIIRYYADFQLLFGWW
jgi:hypothetical protein